jgi:ankyrin repeat protein
VTLNNGNFLLHDAVLSQKYPLIKYLIEKGCDINSQNDEGNTPLHIACIATDTMGYKKEVNSRPNNR